MPAYQGEFDGLCGMYAIANAYEICGYGEIHKELFDVACGALSQARWPGVLQEGTSFGDMRKMLSACQTEIGYQYDKLVKVRYPFLQRTPGTNQDYWRQLDEMLESTVVYCCIVGRSKPSPHWIVLCPDTSNRVVFVDSSPNQSTFRKNRRNVYAGPRRRYESQWRLDRQELIVFME